MIVPFCLHDTTTVAMVHDMTKGFIMCKRHDVLKQAPNYSDSGTNNIITNPAQAYIIMICHQFYINSTSGTRSNFPLSNIHFYSTWGASMNVPGQLIFATQIYL